jgi:hypothetical protein
MEFTKETPPVRFVVPDKPTARQQLAYYSATAGSMDDEYLFRLWKGARALITEWDCELFKMDVNLDEVTDPVIVDVVLWAALKVKNHINHLEEVPKN